MELFDRHLGAIATVSGCEISTADGLPTPSTQPFARVKTLISRTTAQATDLVSRFGGKAHGFIGNAFFHYDPEPGKEDDENILQTLLNLHQELSALGGHLRCAKLTYPDSIEKNWEELLRQKWEALP